jgi:hypothetical protein
MKGTDIAGFAAILAAGFIAGKDSEANDFTNTDLFMIAALLGLGFYLAVVLS